LTPTPALHRLVLAAVRDCPDRGPVLPLSAQPYAEEGCQTCGELQECRAGRGARPGAVTTEECVRCRFEALGADP
jgi:hypothetical protein